MNVDKLHVYYHGTLVGTLAMTVNKKVAFQYNDAWLDNGFAISPFSLPLKKQVFIPDKPYFNGLFGVFADSLPDAWGNLLLNRLLKKNGRDPGSVSVLERLAIVGSSGMGALTYRPEFSLQTHENVSDLDYLAEECQKLLRTEYCDELDGLYRLGGTSGGARPKILTDIDGESWIIKFPAHIDNRDSGKMEFDYSLCAEKCGISMMECRLFPSHVGSGYFGTRRFDRINTNHGIQRVHMLTVAAILELDFEQPSLDYHTLMKLTKILTNNNHHDMENMYRLMCFNVYAHNRDDHSKNFSFLYNESKEKWELGPAYDLTYSNTYYGEHTTSVDNNGHTPGLSELIRVGTAAGLKKNWCVKVAEEIKETVADNLKIYLE